ncbi:hypothetical protein DENSPDRAFT_766670, partial [Dentipellis sp. KUC8613]
YTGCLAHADITYDVVTGAILRVAGVLDHNEDCKKATMKHLPAIPIHEHVVEVALLQLWDGASVSAIQSQNLEMHAKCAYRGQNQLPGQPVNHRYQLLPSDFSGLYRRHHKLNGIDVTKEPQYNVDDWLNPQSPSYKPIIADAVFHYHQRAEAHKHFQICISTPEMEDAAWKFVHEKQLILDGTFGLSSSRLLLWIAMGVDSERKGVPVAFFLFSAPTGNKASHAGYDTQILAELLGAWKKCMSSQPAAEGRVFTPATAITDTDIKERGVLLQTWPKILLLLCKFHLRQCWTNRRATLLGKDEPGKESGFAKKQILDGLKTLEVGLIDSTDFKSALKLIEAEQQHLILLSEKSPSNKKLVDAGLAFIEYLQSYWMSEDLWRSWSQWGRNKAAKHLNVPVEGVLPTTNHLESFNGLLKSKHI